MTAAYIALAAAIGSLVLMRFSRGTQAIIDGLDQDLMTVRDRYVAFQCAEQANGAELIAWCLFLVEILALGWMGLS